jgi:hypothetical protein
MTKTVLVPVELLDTLTSMAEAQAARLVRKHGAKAVREHIEKIAAEARAILTPPEQKESDEDEDLYSDYHTWKGHPRKTVR